jgi:putative RNA ligase
MAVPISLEILNSYAEEGLLRCSKHNEHPLLIWNYTDAVQVKKQWNKVTRICRGLVTDLNGMIVGRPFPKFFNIEADLHEPTEEFEIYEKMDGSLGILFHYADKWHLATRGSFHSPQAGEGFNMLKDTDKLDISLTYCVEIIYPSNRIIVNYGDYKGLTYLSSYNTRTGEEIMLSGSAISMFNECKRYLYDNIQELKDLNLDNKEGFVVRFSNGQRCKIKFIGYLETVRCQTAILNEDGALILKQLIAGKSLEEIVEGVDDEFHLAILKKIDEFKTKRDALLMKYQMIYQELKTLNARDFAKKAKTYPHPGILFCLKRNNKVESMVYRCLKD